MVGTDETQFDSRDGPSQPFCLPLPQLRRLVHKLRAEAEISNANVVLNEIAQTINMPMLTWVPDCSDPYYNADMDEFCRQQGWPESILRAWWQEHATVKMPFYIRCRYEHLPFVTAIDRPNQPTRVHPVQQPSKVERLAAEINRKLGHRSLLTIPVHLPKGRISMLTWAGPLSVAEVNDLLAAAEPELLAVAHYYVALRGNGRKRQWTREDFMCLTPREWDCIRMAAQGHTQAEIGRLQNISSTTVRYHLDHAVDKLGAANRVHAVALAAQLGLLGPIGS